MKRISAEFVHSLNPCHDYPLEVLRELMPKPVELSFAIQANKAPAADRIWLLCQPGVLTYVQRAAWLQLVVARAVRNCAMGSPIDTWARRWLSGADRSRDAASAAAMDAAMAAARSVALAPTSTASAIAARSAARAAAFAAAMDAAAMDAMDARAAAAAMDARAAAMDAARAAAFAARAASMDAARAAELAQQILDALSVLRPKDIRLEVDGG